jgi:hypothetical protein
MKSIIQLVILALITSSCSQSSKEETAISEYVQTVGKTKTDLHFKLISTELVKEVTAQDSIDYWMGIVKGFTNSNALLDTLQKRQTENAAMIAKHEAEGNMGRHMKAYIEDLKKRQPVIDAAVRDLKNYNPDPAKIIGKHIRCKYSIENPFLNNVKQELDQVFFYSIEKGKVFSTI